MKIQQRLIVSSYSRWLWVFVVFVSGCVSSVHYDHVYLAADGKPVAIKLTDTQQHSH